MAQWFVKNLGDAILAQDEQENFKTHLGIAYARADNLADMAAFYRHESEGGLHCEVKVYLSPSSIGVARKVGATPCLKPAPDSLSLLAGSREAWLIHFPEHRREE